jgi:putative DNA primase/helicase
MEFTGDVWKEADINCGFRLAQQWAWAYSNRSKEAHKASFAGGVARHLENMPDMVVTSASFDQGLWMAGVPGGVLNLRTGMVRPARARDMISRRLAAAPGGDCPAFMRFLSEATQGDAAMMAFLQRWAGYCLTGDVRYQKFVYLWGPGGNGKSLFMETMQAMMGSYAVQARAETFVKRAQKGHPEDIARMAGSRLVVVPEISGGDKWDVDLLKEVTGNATMTARMMYKASFTFPVTFKVMSCGNHQPVFPGGVNAAVQRRLIYGKFENQPATVDTTLAEQFRQEMGGIVRWAVEGLRAVQDVGLGVPDSMIEAADEYFANVDPVLRWRDENLERDGKGRITMAEAFQNWEVWRSIAGVHEFTNLSEFSKMLRAKGIFEIVKPQGTATIKGWRFKKPF